MTKKGLGITYTDPAGEFTVIDLLGGGLTEMETVMPMQERDDNERSKTDNWSC